MNIYKNWKEFINEERTLGKNSEFWTISDDGLVEYLDIFQAFKFWTEVEGFRIEITTGSVIEGLTTIYYSGIRIQVSPELMKHFSIKYAENSHQTITVEPGTTERWLSPAERKAIEQAAKKAAENAEVEDLWQNWQAWSKKNCDEAHLDEFIKFLNEFNHRDSEKRVPVKIHAAFRDDPDYWYWVSYDLKTKKKGFKSRISKSEVFGIEKISGGGEIAYHSPFGIIGKYAEIDFEKKIVRKK